MLNPHSPKTANWILPLIVFSQFLCTSLWFAGNTVIPDLNKQFHFESQQLGHLLSAVQFGFISGTLIYALFGISDRLQPTKVFFLSATLASFSNLSIVLFDHGIQGILLFRYFTGFFLAGIYPVGMKIASDHYGKVLGKALGFLVGALVIGTALPHLIKSFSGGFLWKSVFILTSFFSFAGGSLMLAVPEGPYRITAKTPMPTNLITNFHNKDFREASFGYFGHMWELYAFWAFVPLMLSLWADRHPNEIINVHLFSFFIIGGGSLACVWSGYQSLIIGTRKMALYALSLSCLCCLASPLIFAFPFPIFIIFLVIWGFAVIADSPMFSTLVAQHAPIQGKGTALTFITCIGFSITILSIELISVLKKVIPSNYLFVFLALGPALGIIAMVSKKKNKPEK